MAQCNNVAKIPYMAKSTQKRPHPRHFIREWRKHRGLTLERLAERIEVTHGAISQLERGLVNYTQPMLEALASALSCEPSDLLRPPPIDAENELAAYVMRLDSHKREQALRLLRVALDDEKSA